eukprot:784072-Heterocapsa_arctica.AAC.1
MADAFSQENAVYCMDLLGNLQEYVGDTKKHLKDKNRAKYKPATTGMAVIVPYRDMGRVCVQLQSAADFIEKKDMLCKTPKGCLLCKALADTHEHQ